MFAGERKVNNPLANERRIKRETGQGMLTDNCMNRFNRSLLVSETVVIEDLSRPVLTVIIPNRYENLL